MVRALQRAGQLPTPLVLRATERGPSLSLDLTLAGQCPGSDNRPYYKFSFRMTEALTWSLDVPLNVVGSRWLSFWL
jgi:hypothetical protein